MQEWKFVSHFDRMACIESVRDKRVEMCVNINWGSNSKLCKIKLLITIKSEIVTCTIWRHL